YGANCLVGFRRRRERNSALATRMTLSSSFVALSPHSLVLPQDSPALLCATDGPQKHVAAPALQRTPATSPAPQSSSIHQPSHRTAACPDAAVLPCLLQPPQHRHDVAA